ncbi:MAG: methyl-accepting chemotaxis protein [Gammaproteobacteria bacterium]|jgi:methyl-accepting chemotaxis protein|nr:methyl-accepting chemotaxis protein [Gammaproteobacteria bacterium]
MFNPFRNMKVAQKLLLLLAVFLIGFVAVGIAYQAVEQIESKATARAEQLNEFGRIVQRTHNELLAAELDANNLLLEKNVEFLDRFENAISLTKEDLDELRQFVAAEEASLQQQAEQGQEGVSTEEPEEGNIRELLTGLSDALDLYEQLTFTMANAQVEIGLNEGSGLQVDMRAAADGFAGVLKANYSEKLDLHFNYLRRYERDYLLREQEEFIKRFVREKAVLAKLVQNSRFSAKVKKEFTSQLSAFGAAFLKIVDATNRRNEAQAQATEALAEVQPLFDELLDVSADKIAAGLEAVADQQANLAWGFIGLVIAVGMISLLIVVAIARGLTRSMRRVHKVVEDVAQGDFDARANMTGGDELAELGRAFDQMLEERLARLQEAQQENEQVNDSLIGIMRSLAKLGKGDLTVAAPVNEDITGALSDAINSMAESTSNTLAAVRAAAEQVRLASDKGRESVQDTADGMNEIRSTIQETGKRIKQLGERSQEIGGIVKVIDDIAERTSVLALNANMQAAAAGEAGRGFRVVADEVQRLAERSKEATDEITKLVSSIQSETAETASTMERSITQVVKGGELAELAAAQVRALAKIGQQLTVAVSAFKLPQAEAAQSPAGDVTELEKARQIA